MLPAVKEQIQLYVQAKPNHQNGHSNIYIYQKGQCGIFLKCVLKHSSHAELLIDATVPHV